MEENSAEHVLPTVHIFLLRETVPHHLLAVKRSSVLYELRPFYYGLGYILQKAVKVETRISSV